MEHDNGAETFWSTHWHRRKQHWKQLNNIAGMQSVIRQMAIGNRIVLRSVSRQEFIDVFETICENGVTVMLTKRRHGNRFDVTLQKFNIVHRQGDLAVILSGMPHRER